jgi:hypothetical protein
MWGLIDLNSLLYLNEVVMFPFVSITLLNDLFLEFTRDLSNFYPFLHDFYKNDTGTDFFNSILLAIVECFASDFI